MSFYNRFQCNMALLRPQVWIKVMVTWWYGNTFCITGPFWKESTGECRFPSLRTSDVELWCLFCCYHCQAVEQTMELSVILDVITLMWHHCYIAHTRHILSQPDTPSITNEEKKMTCCVALRPQGPFYKHGLTLISAWISNYIHYNVWDEII